VVPGDGARDRVSAVAAQLRSASVLERIDQWKPKYVLAALIALEWVVTLAVALTVRHNGFLYYQGGDQLWHYITAWLIDHGRLAHTSVGYAWAVVLLPFALFGGPNLVDAMPFIVLLNVLVLTPVALVAAYGIGQRIGGRLFGYWTASLWIVVPIIGIKYTDAGYHQRYSELLLPQALGLTAMSDFPSLVVSIVAAFFTVRAVQEARAWDAGLAGLFAGVAIGIKPSNAPLLVGIGLAFLVARHWRTIPYLAAGFAPSVVALALWKGRGEGNLPLFHNATSGGSQVLAKIAPTIGGIGLHQYIHPSWSFFTGELHDIEQHFWSVRVLEWLAIAGTIGLLRRSRPIGVLFGGWFFANLAVKWMTPGRGTIADSDLLRQSIPTIPAALMLLAGILLLFPGLPQKLPKPSPGEWSTRRVRLWLTGVAAALFCLLPAGLAIAMPLLKTSDTLSYYTIDGHQLSAPFATDPSWQPTAKLGPNGTVHLKWKPLKALGGTMDYGIIRTSSTQPTLCLATQGAAQCPLNPTRYLEPRHTTNAVEHGVGAQGWTYYVLGYASWINDPGAGNVYVVSKPVTVTVPR
jgi:hypothetical protein